MVKAKLYRQNHTEKHTHTHLQKEKKEKNIYIFAPKVHLLNLGWFIVYSVIPQMQGTSSWLWRFNPLLPRLLGESPFLFFVRTAPGVQLLFGPTSACRSPEGFCSSLRQDGVKGAAYLGALAHSGRWEGGVQSVGRAWGGRGQRDIAPAWGVPCIIPGYIYIF